MRHEARGKDRGKGAVVVVVAVTTMLPVFSLAGDVVTEIRQRSTRKTYAESHCQVPQVQAQR